MDKIARHLTVIFYFPLVILTFILVFVSGFSWYSSFSGNFSPKYKITDGSFNYSQKTAFFNNHSVSVPVKPFLAKTNVLHEKVLSASAGERWIDINLSNQTLTAFEPNGGVFMQVPVSTGLWGLTPTGTFRVWIKLRYTLMSGGSQADGTYYYLPNVPCTQYFYKGYGLHGTYWHSNFGHPMSHGCVNMYTPDACRLFEWTSPPVAAGQNSARPSAQHPGTKIVIHN